MIFVILLNIEENIPSVVSSIWSDQILMLFILPQTEDTKNKRKLLSTDGIK